MMLKKCFDTWSYDEGRRNRPLLAEKKNSRFDERWESRWNNYKMCNSNAKKWSTIPKDNLKKSPSKEQKFCDSDKHAHDVTDKPITMNKSVLGAIIMKFILLKTIR